MSAPVKDRPGVFDRDQDRILALPSECERMILISKDVTKGRMRRAPRKPCPCECDDPRLGRIVTYRLRHRFVWDFDRPAPPCDEVSRAGLLDGCYLLGKGSMKLRRWECDGDEMVVGCEEGRFEIFRPVDPDDLSRGYVLVFAGHFHGTIGLDPSAEGRDRCCAELLSRGCLVGDGLGRHGDCTICVTYEGRYGDLDPDDLCRAGRSEWTGKLDGLVCCPCPPEGFEEREDRRG